ncbi:MAG: tetratricopeptide repeat protein [Nitrospinales bacterium]
MTVTTSTEKEYKQVREDCGYFELEDYTLISATGEDALSFLQTQTTNDVLAVEIGEGQNNAITDRKARLLAAFSLHRNDQHSAIILIDKKQGDGIVELLETYHFNEVVSFDAAVKQDYLIAIQGPKSQALMLELFGTPPSDKANSIQTLTVLDEEVLLINKTFTGEEGYVLAMPQASKEKILSHLLEVGQSFGLSEIGSEAREILRIETGLPVYGQDMGEKHILPETGLEHSSVSYSKGCYIGQEVIARIKTYGSPSFALMGLILDLENLPPHDAEIKLGSKKIGVIKSSTFSYSLQKNISLAYIHKDVRSPDQVLDVTINGEDCKVTTVLLPFHQTQSRTERASQLHMKALEIYKNEESLDEPVALLREAISLDPKFALGYEALGVFLSKQNKLDEAIALMKRLVEIDPNEIMAHSNLSIYYMQQGRIEDAELEKGEATAIQFEKLIQEGAAKKSSQEADKKRKEEQLKKIEMFKAVMEIDAIDEVANFGLGSIYYDTGQYEDALHPLQTVVENNKDYSAAFLMLGKVFEKLERKDEAAETYKTGIAAASRKGDLMPLNDMKNRLNQILQAES